MTDLGIIVATAVASLAVVASVAMLAGSRVLTAWWERGTARDDWALACEGLDLAREQMDAGLSMPGSER